jgi:hypothetical protein
VAARKAAGAPAFGAALCSALLSALLIAACDASVTSVGEWAPIVEQPSTGQYLEAESGELSGGFSTSADATASNGQYLESSLDMSPDGAPGPSRALYHFTVSRDDDYVIWGRIRSPDVATNRFWFQVDGGEWFLWRISTGIIWFWDDLHDDTNYYRPLVFPLTAGPHQLQLANAVDGVRLDRLYVTADGDEPPGNATPCFPPHSIDLGGGNCMKSCGSYARGDMMTTCLSSVCQDHPIVTSYDCAVCCLVPTMP